MKRKKGILYINLAGMDRKKAGHYFPFTVFSNSWGNIFELYSTLPVDTLEKYSLTRIAIAVRIDKREKWL